VGSVSKARFHLASFGALVAVVAPLALAADRSCRDYEALFRAGKLSALAPDSESEETGEQRFLSQDVDRDGRPDDISLICSGSPSLIPADPCELRVSLSSGKQLELVVTRMYLFLEEGNLYARTQEPGHNDPLSSSLTPDYYEHAIYRIEATTIAQVCSFREPFPRVPEPTVRPPG
jgi:hypothetical protein